MASRQAGKKRDVDADARPRPQDRSGSTPAPRRQRDNSPPRQPRKKKRAGKQRSGFGRTDLLGRGAGVVGGDRRHRRLGLDRHPPAADPVAGNPQAAALDPDPRPERRDARDARRHGRRRGAAARTAGLRAEGLHRHRGPPLLCASRRRSVGHLRARRRRRAASRRLARRLDHHAAARQEPVPDPGAHAHPQAAGSRAGALARTQVLQGADPRALSQPRLFRLRRLRRRGGVAALFRQVGAAIDARRKPRCWPASCKSPSRLAPSRNPDGAERRARHRDRRDGGHEDDQRRRRQARADPPGARGEAGRRRLGQLRRRLGDGRGRRPDRPCRPGHRGRDLDRSGAADRGRTGARSTSSRRRATSSASAKARWWR